MKLDGMKLSCFVVLFMLVCFTGDIRAQGGSNYSIIGVGDLTDANGAFYDGIAGAATAMPSAEHINLSNPAMWTYNKSTRLQFGYRFNQQMVETNRPLASSNGTIYQNNGMVDNISGIFAIDTAGGISASAGLTRISDINYYIANGFEIEKDGLTASGKTYYQGQGGINNAHIGAAFRVHDDVSIGMSLGYYFGDIHQSVQTIYNESTGYSTDYLRDFRLTGTNYRVGVDVIAAPGLNISASYAGDLGLDIENRLIRLANFSTTGLELDTLESLDGTTNLPARLGLGASYLLDRLRFVADLQFTSVSGFEFRPPQNGELKNGLAFAIGAERTPSRFAGARFGEKISYRLGFGYKDLYYRVNGQDISEYYLGAGLSLPLPGRAIIDIGMLIGQRGTLDAELVQESFLRLNFAISIGDSWFIPFEREYD